MDFVKCFFLRLLKWSYGFCSLLEWCISLMGFHSANQPYILGINPAWLLQSLGVFKSTFRFDNSLEGLTGLSESYYTTVMVWRIQIKISEGRRYLGQGPGELQACNFLLSFPSGVLLPAAMCENMHGVLPTGGKVHVSLATRIFIVAPRHSWSYSPVPPYVEPNHVVRHSGKQKYSSGRTFQARA